MSELSVVPLEPIEVDKFYDAVSYQHSMVRKGNLNVLQIDRIVDTPGQSSSGLDFDEEDEDEVVSPPPEPTTEFYVRSALSDRTIITFHQGGPFKTVELATEHAVKRAAELLDTIRMIGEQITKEST